MSILGTLSPEELLDMACRLAEELQDLCNDAFIDGSPLPAMQAVQDLVNEWENDYFSKTNLSWQNAALKTTEKETPLGLAMLGNQQSGDSVDQPNEITLVTSPSPAMVQQAVKTNK